MAASSINVRLCIVVVKCKNTPCIELKRNALLFDRTLDARGYLRIARCHSAIWLGPCNGARVEYLCTIFSGTFAVEFAESWCEE